MNQYKIFLLTLFISAQENVIFGNEDNYNNKRNNASYLYQDFHEIKIQKALTSEDINSNYFDKNIHDAKNDILEELPNFNLNYNNIDFYILIKQNSETKKVFIFVTFLSYSEDDFTQSPSFISAISQSTQNLISMALYKINS